MIHLSFIFWDPKPELFFLPVLHWPILWYGLLFALGFASGLPIFIGILTRFFLQQPDFEKSPKALLSLKKQAVFLTDRVVVYMVVATVVGARLGHFFFYERPSEYLRRPWEIFQFPFNGLASHGAAIAIVIALYLFAWRYRKESRGLTGLRLLDFVSVPTALAGAFIRVGNFFNQEILGKPTDVPWAIIFGHPADHSGPLPRHPVQLYEAASYGVIFLLLWKLSFSPKYLLKKGTLIGLFLILVFGARFIIEFWKLEQSHIVSGPLTMGQLLSIPAVLVGCVLFFWKGSLRKPAHR